MVKIPEAFRHFFQDYEINLVCIVDTGAAALHYKNESVRNLMTQLHLLYKKDWDKIKEMDVELDNDTLAVIASVTGEEYLKKQAEKEGGLKMCNALNELKQESHAEGRAEGEEVMGKLIQILLKEIWKQSMLSHRMKPRGRSISGNMAYVNQNLLHEKFVGEGN